MSDISQVIMKNVEIIGGIYVDLLKIENFDSIEIDKLSILKNTTFSSKITSLYGRYTIPYPTNVKPRLVTCLCCLCLLLFFDSFNFGCFLVGC